MDGLHGMGFLRSTIQGLWRQKKRIFYYLNIRFLGLELHGEKRAYQILILNWHEIVNDVVGGVPVTVSCCPLCGTGTAFHRSFLGANTTFGVSGLLYDSNLLLYDRGSESLWS